MPPIIQFGGIKKKQEFFLLPTWEICVRFLVTLIARGPSNDKDVKDVFGRPDARIDLQVRRFGT